MRTKTGLVVVAAVVLAQVAMAQTAAEVQTWDTTWAQKTGFEQIPFAQRGTVKATAQVVTDISSSKINEVYDAYSNVYNAIGLHPFLTGITAIRHTCNTFDFIAYENIPLPDGTVFPGVTVSKQTFNRARKTYHVETWDFPGIITRQDIAFQKVGPRTVRVTETLEFETFPQFIDIAVQGGVFAHQIVAQGTKQKIEAGLFKHAPTFPEYLAGASDDDECGCDD